MAKSKAEHELRVMSETVPMEYTVPYEWGRLHVSGDAHSAYGMQPLTADILEGGSLEGYGSKRLNIDIFLLGPNQVPGPPHESQAGSVYISSNHFKQGVSVLLGFKDDQTELHTQLCELVAKSIDEIGDEPDADISTITNEDGVPISEFLANSTPQMFAHVIPGLIKDEVSAAVEVWQTDKEHRETYQNVRFAGVAALVGAGIFLAPNFYVDNRVVDPNELIIPGIFASVQLYSAKARLKQFMKSHTLRQARSRLTASFIGLEAAESVHQTYCSRHFDARTKSLLED